MRLSIEDIVARYEAGENGETIAIDAAISTPYVFTLLHRAGVEIRGRRRTVTDDIIREQLAKFHATGGRSTSEYIEWSKGSHARPSLATVRNRGLWSRPGDLDVDPASIQVPVPTRRQLSRGRTAAYQWLHNAGISMSDIADAAGVNVSSVSRAVTAQRPISRGRPISLDRGAVSVETKLLTDGRLQTKLVSPSATKTVTVDAEQARRLVDEWSMLLEL